MFSRVRLLLTNTLRRNTTTQLKPADSARERPSGMTSQSARLHQMLCPCRPVTSSLFLSLLDIRELCLHFDPFRPCCSFSFYPHCESLQLRWSWVEGGDVIIQLSPPLCQKASIFLKTKQRTMMYFD